MYIVFHLNVVMQCIDNTPALAIHCITTLRWKTTQIVFAFLLIRPFPINLEAHQKKPNSKHDTGKTFSSLLCSVVGLKVFFHLFIYLFHVGQKNYVLTLYLLTLYMLTLLYKIICFNISIPIINKICISPTFQLQRFANI